MSFCKDIAGLCGEDPSTRSISDMVNESARKDKEKEMKEGMLEIERMRVIEREKREQEEMLAAQETARVIREKKQQSEQRVEL